jgi:hypothetical protein
MIRMLSIAYLELPLISMLASKNHNYCMSEKYYLGERGRQKLSHKWDRPVSSSKRVLERLVLSTKLLVDPPVSPLLYTGLVDSAVSSTHFISTLNTGIPIRKLRTLSILESAMPLKDSYSSQHQNNKLLIPVLIERNYVGNTIESKQTLLHFGKATLSFERQPNQVRWRISVPTQHCVYIRNSFCSEQFLGVLVLSHCCCIPYKGRTLELDFHPFRLPAKYRVPSKSHFCELYLRYVVQYNTKRTRAVSRDASLGNI